MPSNSTRTFFTRREFFEQTAVGAALTGAVVKRSSAAGASEKSNPFVYDVSRLEKIDPKLLQYEQAARFASPVAEPRRLALGPQDRIYLAADHAISILDRMGVPVNEIPLSS